MNVCTKLLKRLLCVLTTAVLAILNACGGTIQDQPLQPDPEPYYITGIDAVPDQYPGIPDIGTVPIDPTNLSNNTSVLSRVLVLSCNSTEDYEYATAIAGGVGAGTKHFRASGAPANIVVDAQAGVVTVKRGATCVPGDFTLEQYIDAESNGKIARSNTMLVRFGLF